MSETQRHKGGESSPFQILQQYSKLHPMAEKQIKGTELEENGFDVSQG